MSKEIYISSTPHETRLAIVEDEALTEIYYERENEYTLAGSIYNGRVTRVLPGMQSSFVDIGLERDAFLYITDFLEEAPDSDEFDTPTTPDRSPRPTGGDRPEEGARTDRGGRGRRGGRDRDRNQDRPEGNARQQESDMPQNDAQSMDSAAPRESGDTSEIGQGAPGADGSRRWRGRRGRRRGRGSSGQPTDQNREQAPTGYSELESADTESYLDIDAATPPSPSPIEPADEGDRGRRDRGRDGQRRDGQRREQRPDQPQRAPRGFAPSRDLYGVDSGEPGTGPISDAYQSEDAPAEPIILPGESLSKYRKGEPEVPAATKPTVDATPINLAPPANLYTIAEGWDGGAVLPGETLSRRQPSESRSERGSGRQRDSDRGSRRDRNPRSEFRNPATPSAPTPQEQAVPAADSEPVEATPAPSVESFAATAPAAESIAAPEVITHEPAEYEPQDASVSYRVDPVARSEYRQSAPTLEPPVESPEPAAEAETLPVDASLTHSITPAPGEVTEKLQADELPSIAEPTAAEAHDITSIAPTGEMFSDHVEVLPDVASHPAPMEVSEPTSPVRHEGAIVSTDAAPEFAAPAPTGFAPGTGDLSEEILEEEEESTTLHASSIEEMEDLEEETLEGAADLGTMLREMSIDQITRTQPEVEEQDDVEDDFEEGDLEDDFEEQEADASYDAGESEEATDLEEEDAARSGLPNDQEFFEQQFAEGAEENRSEATAGQPSETNAPRREGDRRGRRDGRRDGRRGRSDRSGSGDRERSGHGHGNGRGRHSVQATNLPAISDLLKPGQEILVQIAKEPIAKKGARITSHIALPGRFLVFMPTVNHTGVSRKIESDGERRRLKEILLSEKGDATGGFIVRTAAEGASEEELRSDLRFLLNLWADIKARSESSKSPALIYHDLNLIERILRDQVTDNFSAIWVDTETEYERVLRFLQRFQPSLIRRVKLYLKETPLFEQFGITEEINKALRSKVWLKSGGSIVINQTEALVAIDINTGKFVGKTARLEDTIVKTNLDAIPEIVRQIRLRDLGGIIIIDFIDMDERKNRNRVMAALEDELKNDRAPSKVLQFNDFGLVAITRKRVKQSLERTLSTTCNICTGTGMVKSPITVCNDIYIEMRKMHKHLDRGDVMLRVHPDVVKQLKASGAKWLQEMEEMVGKTILVKSDPGLHPEQFDIH
jgi:ribonuclease E